MAKIREEIEKWQTSLLAITERQQTLENQLATLTAENPEATAKEQALRAEIQELRDQLAELKANPPTPTLPLVTPKTEPPESVEPVVVENPPAIPPAEPPAPTPAPQTKATKLGWV